MSAKLLEFLDSRLPRDIDYDDLAQLCLGMHCYIDLIPEELTSELDKQTQAIAFSEFVRKNFDQNYGRTSWVRYGANFQSVLDKGHWLEVITSMYKKGNTLDDVREEAIRQKFFR